MNITVNFESLEEFQKYMGQQPAAMIVMSGEAAKAMAASAEDNAKKIKKAAQEAPAEAEPVKSTPKAEKPQEEDAGQPDEAPAPEVSEDFRVEVRKTLAKLNKKVGKNMASDLIKEFGVKRLTEVALSDLPALMDKAKEALNAE